MGRSIALLEIRVWRIIMESSRPLVLETERERTAPEVRG